MYRPSRRAALKTGLMAAGALAVPGLVRAQSLGDIPVETTRRNASSFAAQDWRDHFDALGVVTLLADTDSRALH